MVFGRLTTRPAEMESTVWLAGYSKYKPLTSSLLLLFLLIFSYSLPVGANSPNSSNSSNSPSSASSTSSASSASSQINCNKFLYLTFDTGHMGVAPLVAKVLQRQQVRVTFFAANERTQQGDGSLGEYWASWWQARALEGHAFASHTWNHTYWRADKGTDLLPQFQVQPSAGPEAGKLLTASAAQYCEEITQAAHRLQELTGKKTLPLFRAPGGKTSPRLLAVAQSCGYTHVGWSSAGFLGDELPSENFGNKFLLNQALHNIKNNDVLMAHLGIWSRKDEWAPAALEPLLIGLKKRGFCFRTLDEHPKYMGF